MSEERHRVLHDAFARWNAGDRELNLDLVHPEFVIHSGLTKTDFSGEAGFKEWAIEIDEQFDRWNVKIDELADAPDGRVLALGRIAFHGRSSGIESEQEVGWVFRFDGGRVIEMWNFPHRDDARREAGLP